jgi:cytochrome c551/c552
MTAYGGVRTGAEQLQLLRTLPAIFVEVIVFLAHAEAVCAQRGMCWCHQPGVVVVKGTEWWCLAAALCGSPILGRQRLLKAFYVSLHGASVQARMQVQYCTSDGTDKEMCSVATDSADPKSVDCTCMYDDSAVFRRCWPS